MQQHDKTFIFKFVPFCTIIVGLYAILLLTVFKNFYLDIFPTIVLFFITYTWTSHKLLTEASIKRPVQFQNMFLGTVTVKIFVCLMLMLVYLFFNKENAKPFLAFTLINYFLFTIFEVKAILTFIKTKKSDGQNS